MPAKTIAQRMAETGGRTTGFDYVRGGLAVSVILLHSPGICYGTDYSHDLLSASPLVPLARVILPAFFALSGFLVTGSLVRTKTIYEFLTLRALRVIPALLCQVIISALILGPLLTVSPLYDYFQSTLFLSYFWNSIGYVHYRLPGLFLHNPVPNVVNAQLWTIPIELRCYIGITPALALIGGARHKWRALAILIGSLILFPLADWHLQQDFSTAPVKALFLSFLAGALLYLYQEQIPLNKWLCLACAVLAWVLLPNPHTVYLASVPVAYVTVYLGLLTLPQSFFSRLGDYSYGVYIYGFAVQQTYAYLLPDYRNWWINLVLSLVTTLAFAVASWHLIEHPVLIRRERVVRLVDRVVRTVTGVLAPPRVRESVRVFFRGVPGLR